MRIILTNLWHLAFVYDLHDNFLLKQIQHGVETIHVLCSVELRQVFLALRINRIYDNLDSIDNYLNEKLKFNSNFVIVILNIKIKW